MSLKIKRGRGRPTIENLQDRELGLDGNTGMLYVRNGDEIQILYTDNGITAAIASKAEALNVQEMSLRPGEEEGTIIFKRYDGTEITIPVGTGTGGGNFIPDEDSIKTDEWGNISVDLDYIASGLGLIDQNLGRVINQLENRDKEITNNLNELGEIYIINNQKVLDGKVKVKLDKIIDLKPELTTAYSSIQLISGNGLMIYYQKSQAGEQPVCTPYGSNSSTADSDIFYDMYEAEDMEFYRAVWNEEYKTFVEEPNSDPIIRADIKTIKVLDNTYKFKLSSVDISHGTQPNDEEYVRTITSRDRFFLQDNPNILISLYLPGVGPDENLLDPEIRFPNKPEYDADDPEFYDSTSQYWTNEEWNAYWKSLEPIKVLAKIETPNEIINIDYSVYLEGGVDFYKVDDPNNYDYRLSGMVETLMIPDNEQLSPSLFRLKDLLQDNQAEDGVQDYSKLSKKDPLVQASYLSAKLDELAKSFEDTVDERVLKNVDPGRFAYAHIGDQEVQMPILNTLNGDTPDNALVDARTVKLELDKKVTAVEGMGLSEQNFTLAEKNKLAAMTPSDGEGTSSLIVSVNGYYEGDIVLNKSDIGLSKVDNTTDMEKPVSTAQQDALDQKFDADDLVKNYNSTDNTKPLAASVARELKAEIDSKAASNHNHDSVYATKGEVDLLTSDLLDSLSHKVDKTTTINGHALGTDIVLTPEDIGSEPAIETKGTAFNKNFGTTSGTIAEGNDSRIVNAVPNTRKIANIALNGDITKTQLLDALNVEEGSRANVQADWNATVGDAVILNKPETFTPSEHNHDDLYYKKTEVDGFNTLLQNTIGTKVTAVQGMGLSQENFTTELKLKLELMDDGSESGEVVLNPETVKSLYEQNDNTNAFSDAEKSKLEAIEAGAQKNTITSVNNKTGVVSLSAADVSALPSTHAAAAVTTPLITKWDATSSGFDTFKVRTDNPHSVTKSQVGLSKVENKTASEILSEITAGNIPTLAQSKIDGLPAKLTELDNHILDKDNPHEVTATQLGLGKVENKNAAEILAGITIDHIPNIPNTKLTGLSTELAKKVDKKTTAGLHVYGHSGSTEQEVALLNAVSADTLDNDKLLTNKAVRDALTGKMNVVEGMGLSQENFTTSLKGKLDGIQSGAEKNVLTSVNGKIGEAVLTAEDVGALSEDHPASLLTINSVDSWNQVIVDLNDFKERNDNPHGVTKAQVGLSNVDNTSDANKPISTAAAAAFNNINKLIPTEATETNKLADKAYVTNAVQSLSSNYVTYDDEANPFPTLADLRSATVFYMENNIYTPQDNDYALVTEDETKSNGTTRYIYINGNWVFQYSLNVSFTQAQTDAMNSGIISSKVTDYDSHLTNKNNPHGVTKAQVGLDKVENKTAAEILSEITATNIPTLDQSKISGLTTSLETKLDKRTTTGKFAYANNGTTQLAVKIIDTVPTGTTDNDALVTKAGILAALDAKVNVVSGKGLSTNDFTNDLKTKLTEIEVGAQRNTISSVNGQTGEVVLTAASVGALATSHPASLIPAGFVTNTVEGLEDLELHLIDTDNPHGVTKAQVGLDKVENKTSAEILAGITATHIPTLAQSKVSGLTDKISSLDAHLIDKDNPHEVTASQLGLENFKGKDFEDILETITANHIPNLAQSKITGLTDKLSVLDTHAANTSNPHGVTKAQVGLDKVENKNVSEILGSLTAAGVPNLPMSKITSLIDTLATKLDNKTTEGTFAYTHNGSTQNELAILEESSSLSADSGKLITNKGVRDHVTNELTNYVKKENGNIAEIKDNDGVNALDLFSKKVKNFETSTAAATVSKTVSGTAPEAGEILAVKFVLGNTANSVKVKFGVGSDIPVLIGGRAVTGTANTGSMNLAAESVVLFYFDGTSLHLIGSQDNTDENNPETYVVRYNQTLTVAAPSSGYNLLGYDFKTGSYKSYYKSASNNDVSSDAEFDINGPMLYDSTATAATTAQTRTSTIYAGTPMTIANIIKGFPVDQAVLGAPLFLVGKLGENGGLKPHHSSDRPSYQVGVPTYSIVDADKIFWFVGYIFEAGTAPKVRLELQHPCYAFDAEGNLGNLHFTLNKYKINASSTETEYDQAYIKKSIGGTDSTDLVNISDAVINSALAKRTTKGDLLVPATPDTNASATSKQYVDNSVSTKISHATSDGKQYVSKGGAWTELDVSGKLDRLASHTTNDLVYIRSKSNGSAVSAILSDTATAQHVVKRTLSGDINVPLVPAEESSSTSKKYVDGLITDLSASIAPSTHAHGNVNDSGELTGTPVALAEGDYLVMSDTSNSGKLNKGILIGTDGKIPMEYIQGVAASGHTHSATDITSGTLDAARIPSLAPSKITQDSSNRFVTDTQMSNWNAKQSALNGTGFVKSTDGVITYDTNTYVTADHSHGDITKDGKITSAVISPATGDAIILSDSSASNALKRGISLNGSGKIPFTALESTPLTSFTETDPTVPSHVKAITTSDISNWNSKLPGNHITNDIADGSGALKKSAGSSWYWDNNSYSLSNHGHGNISNTGTLLNVPVGTTTDVLIIANASTRAIQSGIALTSAGKIPQNALDLVLGNETITLTGDVTGSGTTAITTTLASVSRTDTTSSASPEFGESFTAVDSITSDTKGRVTKINLKTVNIPVLPDHPTLSVTTSGTGNVITGLTVTDHAITVTKGSALTSFTETDPAFTSWRNTDVTNNLVYAGPAASGATDKKAAFRSLVAADIPTLTKSKISDFSHTHGNITNDGTITDSQTIATGDSIIIADASNSSKLTKGVTFGTSTTTFLANNGTWVTPPDTKYTLAGLLPATTGLVQTKEYVLKTKYSSGAWVFEWQEVNDPYTINE